MRNLLLIVPFVLLVMVCWRLSPPRHALWRRLWPYLLAIVVAIVCVLMAAFVTIHAPTVKLL